jgi:hypothetical protein
MKRTGLVALLLGGLLLVVTGCVVHHRKPRHHRHPRGARVEVRHTPPPKHHEPPPPEHHEPPPPDRTPPPPDRTPPPPDRTPPPPDRTPPPPAKPGLTVKAIPTTARRGEMIELHLTPNRKKVFVHINGRPVPMRRSGNIIRVTIPGDARIGPAGVEVMWQGRRHAVAVEVAR